MPVLLLTQNLIDQELKCPPGKSRVEYCDSSFKGLYVLIGASGTVSSYYLRYKDANGKTCHWKLGRTTELTLAEARKEAKRVKAEIHLGADPCADQRARLAVLTFEEFFEQHYLPYVRPRKRSWKRDEELYRLRIKPVFGKKRLSEITRQQIQTFHTDLRMEELAAATCDHHVKLLKHALNLAVDWEFLNENPAKRVPLFNEDNQVEHLMSEEELRRLMVVLKHDANRPICLIAMFLLSTGGRLNEALSARWKDVDRQGRVWRIAAKNSKSKRIRSVPLNDTALAVLDQIDTERDYEYIFVNRETGKPYTSIQRVWLRLRREAGLPHLRIHDLRHQFASFLVNSGREIYEVQKILGHSSPSVTQRYAHLSSKSLQDASNSAAVIINGAIGE